MTKREFIKQFLKTTAILPFLNACMPEKQQAFLRKTGANAAIGHLLHTPLSAETVITKTENLDTLIIGGGIAGLSAGYFLEQEQKNNFLVVELDDTIGGNSKSDKNKHSAFPLGAHYLPIPNLDNTPLIDFLYKKGLITAINAEGVPTYSEYDLCHDPEDRILLNNYWEEGLLPHNNLNKNDIFEINKFKAFIETLKKAKGNDGKVVFTIPLSNGSTDKTWADLDKISFAKYIQQAGYTSPFLLWYFNYCCKDDYGQDATQVSAFAGLHYFAARQGKGTNCPENTNLTWAKGNAHLADLLAHDFKEKIRTQQLVRKITIENDGVTAIVYDALSKNHYAIKAKKVIMATPFFVRKRLLSAYDSPTIQAVNLQHQPWLVATITVKYFEDKNGFPLAWDNVFYKGKTHGFIFAQHQALSKTTENFIFTLYKPLCQGDAATVRKTYYQKTDEALRDEILEDLVAHYPLIATQITDIAVHLWGHGMVSPAIDYLKNPIRTLISQPVQNKIYFAHTDYSGISIFEEAFAQGHQAAFFI